MGFSNIIDCIYWTDPVITLMPGQPIKLAAVCLLKVEHSSRTRPCLGATASSTCVCTAIQHVVNNSQCIDYNNYV